MIGISMQKFLLIAFVALIVIGPRELPGMMRTIARGFGMAQRTAREFHTQLDRMVQESELADLHRDIEGEGASGPRGRAAVRQEDGPGAGDVPAAPHQKKGPASGLAPSGAPGG